jgi:putative cell wall-binding protein
VASRVHMGFGVRLSRSRRFVIAWLVVAAFIATLLVGGGSSPAHAEGSGSISGTVTTNPVDPDAMSIATLYELDPNTNEWFATNGTAADSSGKYTIPGLSAGTYKVGFYTFSSSANFAPQYYNNKTTLDSADPVVVTDTANAANINAVMSAPVVTTSRISGNDRFETAVEVSKTFAPFATGEGVVYIADGLDYPDALSAAPAAALRGGPLLLTLPTAVPAAVTAELRRLKPDLIIIVGGEAVVSPAVFDSLATLAPRVERQAGENRYETSRLVTEKAFGTVGATSAYLATGTDFPDALSASPAAAAASAPVLLVDGRANTVDVKTLSLLKALGTSNLLIAGGVGTVSSDIEASLKTSIDPEFSSVIRLAGSDRYRTSISINGYAFSHSEVVYLAVGTGYADALAGAALAGYNKAPLFVVPATCVLAEVKSAIKSLGATSVVLMGGTGALSSDVADLKVCS